MDWRRQTTRRLGYTAGLLDELHTRFDSNPLTVSISLESHAIAAHLTEWWGGTIVEQKRFFRSPKYLWVLDSQPAYSLLVAVCPFMPLRGRDILEVLITEKKRRKEAGIEPFAA